MKRVSVLMVGLVAMSGCTFGARTCVDPGDCAPSTDQCVDGFCVERDGGSGGGGGSTGGGGGSTGGGGMTGGGGSTGGGGGTCQLTNCSVGQECGAQACVDVALEIQMTTTPGVVGLSPVPAAGVVRRAGGAAATGVKLPQQVTVAAEAGLTSVSTATVDGSGAFTFNVAATSGSNGPKQVTVSFMAGGTTVQKPFTVTADTQGPAFGLVIPGAVGEYKRDAVVPAIVTSNEGLSDAGLSLGGTVMRRLSTGMCTGFGTTPDASACFELDFSAPKLDALDGGFAVALSGTDGVGNSAGNAAGTLLVTRVRWERQAQQVQALAVGSTGTLFVGTSSTVVGFAPDGTLKGDAGVLGDVQSLAVSSDGVLFAAYNSAMSNKGRIEGIAAFSSVSPSGAVCEGGTGSRTYSGIALASVSGESFALGSVNSVSNDGKGCFYGISVGNIPFAVNSAALDSQPVSTTVSPTAAVNVVVSGQSASFLVQNTSGAWWQPVTLNGTMTPTLPSSPQQFGSDASAVSLGQAVFGSNFLIGGMGATNRQVSIRGSSSASGTLGVAAADKGVPALASATEAYIGQASELVRFSPSDLVNSGPVASLMAGDLIRTSPVLGAARTVGAMPEGYAVSRAGRLVVFRRGTTETWQATLASGETVLTHPAFDCNRASPTTKTGILYVGTQSGKVFSIIVDSPKLLEGNDVWPKYQRTMGNAGNTDATNFPINWPSCPN